MLASNSNYLACIYMQLTEKGQLYITCILDGDVGGISVVVSDGAVVATVTKYIDTMLLYCCHVLLL